MEAIVSAIMGDLASRSVSFLVNRFSAHRNRTAPIDDEMLDCLRRLLLRVHVIVEEAEGRRVTNHAMLRQLSALREEMYRGQHALHLNVSRRRRFISDDADDGEMSRRSAFTIAIAKSEFNPAKRVCLVRRRSHSSSSSDGESRTPMQQVLRRLEAMVADVKGEFVVLLTGCPRLSHQPYSVYLFMDKCMFGRQMETESVIAFLLQAEEEDEEDQSRPGVLSISGSRRAGKTTLVEHACNDERVRGHFSQIVSLTRANVIGDENVLNSLITSRSNEERVLAIVELDGDRNSKGLDWTVNEALFRRFYSACKSGIMPSVSKIIVTSRSDKVASLGRTAEPYLHLQRLTEEAFWYFFKARAFGSTDPSEHPEMLSTAMEMAEEMGRSFAAANIFGGLMRSNFHPRFWSLTLNVLRGFKQGNLFTHYHTEQPNSSETDSVKAVAAAQSSFVFLDDYQIGSSCSVGDVALPVVSLQDVLFGRAKPRGKFDVLAWKSPVPPHYSYAYS